MPLNGPYHGIPGTPEYDDDQAPVWDEETQRFTPGSLAAASSTPRVINAVVAHGMSTSKTAAQNAIALQAAIAAAASAITVTKRVFIDAGTFLCDPITIPGNDIEIVGAGRNATVLDYRGSATFLTNSAPGTTRFRWRLSDLTIDTRNAGAGHKALVVDNMLYGLCENVYLNGTGATGTALQLVGSASKSTYFNRFVNCHIVNGTTCVDIGDQCNANSWIGGVIEGAGKAVVCAPGTTTTDTCKFIDVAIQTSNATVLQLGSGAVGCTHFNFIGCRFEPAASTLTLGANASRIQFIGGTLTNVTISDSGTENDFIVPSAGLLTINHVNATAKRTLDLKQINAGITFGDDPEVCLYRRTADHLKTDGNFEAGAALRSYQGGAASITVADASIIQGGMNANQSLFIDAKGTGELQLNRQAISTGGIRLELAGGKLGFYGANPVVKPAVTGSRGGNAALASLLTQLATLGLITDSTTA